jgi:hypothetical protein
LVLLLSWRVFLPTSRGRGRRRLLRGIEGDGGGGSGWQPLNSLLDFLQAEIVGHLLKRREGRHVREDGAEVFKVLVQLTHDVQHENAVGDIDIEVGEALHLLTVVVDAEIALNEAPEGGIDVKGASFMVVEKVVLQGQPGVVSHVAALLGDVLQGRGDGSPDPRLDDVVHPVSRRNADIRGVEQHVIGERVMPDGEQDVVAPSGVVRGGEVQHDRDERKDVLHTDSLDVDVGDDSGIVFVIRRSSMTGGGRGRHRRRRLDQGCRDTGLLDEDGSRALLLLQERGGGKDPGAGIIIPFLCVGGDHGVEFLSNSAASTAWQSLSVAIGGGGTAHQEATWLTRDEAEGERATGP